jgi:hypothetical protein
VSDAAALEAVEDFLVFFVLGLDAVSPAADLSAAAASFFVFFFDFCVVVELEVSLELVCALAKAGEIPTVSSRQQASARRVNLYLV